MDTTQQYPKDLPDGVSEDRPPLVRLGPLIVSTSASTSTWDRIEDHKWYAIDALTRWFIWRVVNRVGEKSW